MDTELAEENSWNIEKEVQNRKYNRTNRIKGYESVVEIKNAKAEK